MGCLVNLFKIFLGLIMIAIMLIVGYKLIFDPYRPEKGGYKSKPSAEEVKYEVPVQLSDNHDYIMENISTSNLDINPKIL